MRSQLADFVCGPPAEVRARVVDAAADRRHGRETAHDEAVAGRRGDHRGETELRPRGAAGREGRAVEEPHERSRLRRVVVERHPVAAANGRRGRQEVEAHRQKRAPGERAGRPAHAAAREHRQLDGRGSRSPAPRPGPPLSRGRGPPGGARARRDPSAEAPASAPARSSRRPGFRSPRARSPRSRTRDRWGGARLGTPCRNPFPAPPAGESPASDLRRFSLPTTPHVFRSASSECRSARDFGP